MRDLGVTVDRRVSFEPHHQKTMQKLNLATFKVMRILRGAAYAVKQFVWSVYLLPIATSGSLVARTQKKRVVGSRNLPNCFAYLSFFFQMGIFGNPP